VVSYLEDAGAMAEKGFEDCEVSLGVSVSFVGCGCGCGGIGWLGSRKSYGGGLTRLWAWPHFWTG
jgi:hypothetical protein